ncbi:MAG: squalene--hopene cyclase [Actinobacteria bacterium]|nr:squalene--hopene cyclase [Actinomycetota bacterium]
MTTVIEAPRRSGAEAALARGVERLLSLQSPEGWWKGELETNVTMDAEDLLLRQFLGIRTAEETRCSANWIRSQQREDGTWGVFFGAPPDLSTTIEAYTALRLAGDPPHALHMRQAAEFVLDEGGVERARVFTKIWLSLFGLWSWRDVPAMPPELIFLRPWMPLNLYDFACWARQTVAALTVAWAYRPVRPIPIGIDELRRGGPAASRFPITDRWGEAFVQLDRVLHAYERRPLRALRRRALQRVERWIVDRQEADGSWGGIQPPWVYSLMALHLRGYPLDHPAVRRGLEGLDGFTIVEGDVRRLEACQSPVWDTALALIALADAGVGAREPAVERAAAWLVGEEIRRRGDWAVRRPRLVPSGWAFEFANDWYPDIDDTAEVVLALRRARPTPELEGAARRGVDWLLGMASSNGGWGAFDADNCRALVRRLPFCDFGEVIDPPSADVTAHVVELLAGERLLDHSRLASGVEFLLREQEPDGSWFGRWGANHLYGTGAAVPALVAAGIPVEHPAIRRAVSWLTSVQNEDGGFGEDLRSYVDPAWRGHGASTPSQTAWALLALEAAGENGRALEGAVDWLVRTQLPDGGWDEPWFTGTGFPGDFYINYHLYRLVFPLSALGRIVRGGTR